MYWMSLLTAFSCLPGGVYAEAGPHTAKIASAAVKAVRWSLIGRRPALSIGRDCLCLLHRRSISIRTKRKPRKCRAARLLGAPQRTRLAVLR